MAKKKGTGFTRYTTYYFNDQDPIIGIVFTGKRKTGMTDAEIAAKAKLSPSTPRNWFNGKTRSPKFDTIAAAAVAVGIDNLPITSETRARFKRDNG